MFKALLDTTTAVLRLAQDVQENRAEIKETRSEFREIATIVERLRLQVEQVGEREARERQVMMLQIENALLRERQALALPETAGGA